jgi:hypothetical protein
MSNFLRAAEMLAAHIAEGRKSAGPDREKILLVMAAVSEFCLAFDPSKHPRADDGKFGNGGGNHKLGDKDRKKVEEELGEDALEEYDELAEQLDDNSDFDAYKDGIRARIDSAIGALTETDRSIVTYANNARDADDAITGMNSLREDAGISARIDGSRASAARAEAEEIEAEFEEALEKLRAIYARVKK